MSDLHEEAMELVRKYGSVAEAARASGINYNTLKSRVYREGAKESSSKSVTRPEREGAKADIDTKVGKGWLELTDYEMPKEEDVLAKHNLDPACWRVVRVVPNQWQGFYKSKKTRTKEESGETSTTSHEKVTLYSLRVYVERVVAEPVSDAAAILAGRIRPLTSPLPRAERLRAPKEVGQLGVFGLYDVHIGALAWEGETDENNNANLAVARCNKAIDELADAMGKYPIEKLIVPIGNDFMHYDNERGETSSGNTVLDFDSRYARVLVHCHDVLARLADRSLDLCDDVEFLLVAGNHDRITSLHLAHWLKQRYRSDARVTVDTSMIGRKYRLWGNTLLGFAHGDGLNLKNCYRIMAEEAREHWSSATCREIHVGDKHHRKQIDQTAIETLGRVTVRQNPSLAPRDRWTYHHAFDAVRCADVYRYDPRGFVGMHTCYA